MRGDPYADLDTVRALLASGKNVISTHGYLYPQAHGSGLSGALEEACEQGGVSIHGTGVNPGFMSDLMPLTLSRLTRGITPGVRTYLDLPPITGRASRRLRGSRTG